MTSSLLFFNFSLIYYVYVNLCKEYNFLSIINKDDLQCCSYFGMFVSKGNVCVTEHIASLSSTIARTTCKMQYFYFFLICVYKKYFDIIKIKRKLATVIHFPGALHVTGAITSMFFFTSRHYICRHTSPLFDTRDEVAIFTTRSINNRY